MKERFKELRKSLNMTQSEIGSVIGITKSTVSLIESGKQNLTERNMQTLTKELDVNPLWLKTGEGDMFLSIKTDLVDQLAKEYKLDDTSKELIRSFLELDQEQRDYLIGWLKNVFDPTKKEEQ